MQQIAKKTFFWLSDFEGFFSLLTILKPAPEEICWNLVLKGNIAY